MRNLFNSRIYARFSVSFLLATALAVLAGCTGSSLSSSTGGTGGTGGAAPGTPTLTITLTPTNSIGSGVSTTVTATLKDGAGNGIAGAVIGISTDPLYGTLSQTSALTNASGVATAILAAPVNGPSGAASVTVSVQNLPSGAPAAAASLSASTGYGVGGVAPPTVGSVVVTSNAPLVPAVTGVPSITADGFATATISATVTTTAGVAIQGATVNFATSKGSLPIISATTNASGVATVTLTAPTLVGNATIVASTGGSSGSTNIKFIPGAAALVTLSLLPTTTAASGVVALHATVSDQNGNLVGGGQAVSYASSTNGSGSSTGGFFTPATSNTNVLSVATTNYTAGSCATALCTDILTVTAGNAVAVINLPVISSNTNVFGISGSAGNTLIPVDDGTGATPTTAGNPGYTVILATVAGAQAGTAVGFSTTAGKLSTSYPPNAIVAASTALTDASGIARLYLVAPTSTGNATVTVNTAGYSANVLVTFVPGPPATIGLNAKPSTVQPGGSVLLTAGVVDVHANPVGAGQTVNFTAASGAAAIGTFAPSSATTDVNGIVNVGFTAGACPTSPCTEVLTAKGTNTLVTKSTPLTVSSSAVVVGTLSMSTGATSLPTGGSSTLVSATVKDSSLNPMSGQTVTFTTSAGCLSASTSTCTAGVPLITSLTATTNSSGVAQVYLFSSNNLGTANLMASASGFSQTANVQFVAGNPTSISLIANPASVSSGATSTFSATVADTNGNPVSGQTVTFSFPSTCGGGTSTCNISGATLASVIVTTDTNGLATTVYTAGATTGTDTVKATLANGINTTASVAVTASVVPTANSLSLFAIPTSIKTDNSNLTTVTVTALSASNAVVPNVVVTLGAQSSVLSAQTVTTGSNGQATFTLSSGVATRDNRTATITATAGLASTQLPVQVVGSTITANPNSGISLPNNGTSPTTVTFAVKDAGGNPIANSAISLNTTGTGTVAITPVTSPANVTDVNGQYIVTIAGGATTGAVTVTGTAAGTTASVGINVTPAAATFAINGLIKNGTALTPVSTNNFSATAMQTSDSLVVTVAAPASANVDFVTTMGTWTGGTNTKTVPVVAGTVCGTITTVAGEACATLTTAAAGLANVQVFDQSAPINSDTLTVSMTATTPAVITVQASPSVVPKAVGTTTGVSTLIVTVTDVNGLPVGGAPVAFSILNPTGGGESVSPAVAYTAATGTASLSLGQAMTTFTSGSLSSGQGGIQVRAQVLGFPAVVTEAAGVNLTSSGNDAGIVIGGSAGSVAFGQATVVGENSNLTAYILPMSVMVADSNGNPAPAGTVVNLSLWPIAWSTGTGCLADPDGYVRIGAAFPATYTTGNGGTFFNEDANENLMLDTTPLVEDGTRIYAASGTVAITPGTMDTAITPANSEAGTVPSTVTTDASGVATFNLTYAKTSAIWTVVRMRAKTVVQGSDAVGQMIFRLAASKADFDYPTICRLPDSHYLY